MGPCGGKDHTYNIKNLTNVKVSVEQAEQHYQAVKRDQLKSDFDLDKYSIISHHKT